ncbi:MAG: hypothetical protein AB7F35_00930 [Acetobacteraceae bacterium]
MFSINLVAALLALLLYSTLIALLNVRIAAFGVFKRKYIPFVLYFANAALVGPVIFVALSIGLAAAGQLMFGDECNVAHCFIVGG